MRIYLSIVLIVSAAVALSYKVHKNTPGEVASVEARIERREARLLKRQAKRRIELMEESNELLRQQLGRDLLEL